MRIARAALLNAFRANQFFDALPQIDKSAVKIYGYPEYAVTIDTLPPEHRKEITKLATRIVSSHRTNNPIVGFSVAGHADVPLREKRENQAQFAKDVSTDRAVSARDALLEAIRREPGGAEVAKKIVGTAKGFGSEQREKIPSPGRPLTEEEMKKNRRVEIFIAEATLPPPAPRPKPTPPPKPLEGTNWRIQIKGGSVVSAGIPESEVGSTTVYLKVEITDVERKQSARFNVIATGAAAQSVTFPAIPSPVTTSTITEGKPTSFTTTKMSRLSDFEGDVEIGQSPGASVSVLSSGGEFAFSFTSLERTGSFTRPTVVLVEGGSPAISLPQASLGGILVGKMKMEK